MLDQQLRDLKEATLKPLTAFLKDVHPTTITLMGGIIGVVAGVVVMVGCSGAGLAFWLMNRVLDGLDGTLARQTDRQSDLGAYLDILIDHLIYAFIPVALMLANPAWETALALLFMLSTFYINAASWMYLSSLLEKRNLGAKRRHEKTSVTMPPGLIEGTETIIFYTLFFIFPAYLTALFSIFALLILYTIGQRIAWSLRFLD